MDDPQSLHKDRHPMIVALILLLLTAPAAAESSPMLVFVSLNGDKQIAAFHLNASTGQLTDAARTAFPGTPGPMAISKDRRRLFAADRANQRVITYQIDSATGALAQLAATETAGNPICITLDGDGAHLLVACVQTDKAAVHSFDDRGTAVAPPLHIAATPNFPHGLRQDRMGRYAYATCMMADAIAQWRYHGATGALTPLDPPTVATAAGAGPRLPWPHPTLDVLYVVNEKNSTMSVWRVDAAGRLEAIQSLPTLPADFTAPNTGADVEVTPTGRFLITSNRGHDSLALFAVDPASGTLTPRGHTPTDKTPRDFTIDPTGRFVLVGGQDSGTLAVHRIDEQAATLTRLSSHPVGKLPVWVTVTDTHP